MGKAVSSTLRNDTTLSAGSLQLCAGQEGECEAAIHAMVDIYEDEDTHGIIQVDARNAFNTINRSILLHNIDIICPVLSIYAQNSYAKPSRLFVNGGGEIKSREGTTQGCPIAMPMYAIDTRPLLYTIIQVNGNERVQIKHVAFADDLTGAGILENLRKWWDLIITFGKYIGYNANPGKSWLIVKANYSEEATKCFANTGINIKTEGKRHLGAVIGNGSFKDEYVKSKIDEWIKELRYLTKIAKIEPHATYVAHGIRNRYTYVMRTIPNISSKLKCLDAELDSFVNAILDDYKFSSADRKLFSLPVKLGGLAIPIFSEISDTEYENSRKGTKDLTQVVKDQKIISETDRNKLKKVKQEVKRLKNEKNKAAHESLIQQLQKDDLKVHEATTEAGASNWLTAIPLKNQGFYLDTRTFWDALCLRYNTRLRRMPEKCVCGNHKGGYIAVAQWLRASNIFRQLC